jgi:hypothetical protein
MENGDRGRSVSIWDKSVWTYRVREGWTFLQDVCFVEGFLTKSKSFEVAKGEMWVNI